VADISVALVGYGLAGSVFHAPLIEATDGLALTTVVTGDPDRAAAARNRYPGVQIRADAEQLWTGPASAGHDLVVVATPNRSHAALARAALTAGLPVVVDKPVTATVGQARELQALAEQRGLLLSVFHNRRWDGDALTVRQLLAEDALGRVHRFESRYERWRPIVAAERWRERPDPDEAGGLLYDLGSHLVDQALVLFGPVDAAYAELGTVRAGAQVDDDVFLALTHASGTRSHLWASAVAADQGPRMRLLGDRGAYVKDGMDVQEAALHAGGTPRDGGWGVEPESAWGRLGTPGHTRRFPTRPGAYQDFYAGIVSALAHGGEPPVPIGQAIDVLVVLEAARTSARTGSVVDLGRAGG
jgi:scyllo-inositol 2-dehydrogenase (NADP+)